jgi:uncharacterized protein with NRDE domain
MCLVVFAWQAHPKYRLILAGNRDEAHNRPTQDAHWWPDNESILAGRDVQSGRAGRKSRGVLVTDFVAGSESAEVYESTVANDQYAGFSLLICDGDSMSYLSNRDDLEAKLDPGIYGLSNASLDTPWSKVVRARSGLESLIDGDSVNETELMRLLADRTTASVDDVQAGDLPFEIARALTAPFIVAPDYGTRSSSTVLWGTDGVIEFCERRFDRSGNTTGESRFRFQVE